VSDAVDGLYVEIDLSWELTLQEIWIDHVDVD
jgi:hypothetical protein